MILSLVANDGGPAIVLDANVAAIITALALLITSLSGLIVAIRTRKENARGIEQVHTLVNNRATDQDRRINQLGQALTAAGVAIPVPVSATPPPKSYQPGVASSEGQTLTGTVTGTVAPAEVAE